MNKTQLSLWRVFNQNKEIVVISLFYLLLYCFNLDKLPNIWMDEAWFSNPAYTLITKGKLGTTLLHGWYNIQNYTYWEPPVYFLLLAASFKLFGFGLIQGRILSVSLGLICVVFTYFLAKQLYNKKVGILAAILLICNILFFVAARQVRMEIGVTTFTLIALYLILLAIKESKPAYYFLSGIFAMLSMLSHPNGVLGIISIYLVLLILGFSKSDSITAKVKTIVKEKGMYFFTVALFLVFIPYLIYIFMDFHAFKKQFMWNIGGSPSNPFKNLLSEPTRYINYLDYYGFPRLFTDGNVILISISCIVIFLVILVTCIGFYNVLKRRMWSDKFLLIVLFAHIVLFAFIVSNKTGLYLSIVLPYWSIILAVLINDIHVKEFLSNLKRPNKQIAHQAFILLLLGGLILANSGVISYALYSNKDCDHHKIEIEVLKYIPKGSTVIGETTYWIDLYDDYEYHDYHILFICQNQKDPYKIIKSVKPEYILFDDRWATGYYGIRKDHKYMIASKKFISENCTKIASIPKDKSIILSPIIVYKVIT